MKIRRPRFWESLLALGLVLGVTGCRDDAAPAGSAAMLSGLSPQPMLAQIGDGFPLPSEKQEVSVPVTPGQIEPQAIQQDQKLLSEAMVLPPKLSPGVDEVVQLARAQLGDEVLLAYIDSSPARFNLRADDILYLHDLGLSTEVIAAMIRHDQNLPVPGWESPSESVAEAPVTPRAEEMQSTTAAPPTAVAVSTETAPAVETTVTHNYFYNTLAPYGTWMELPDYGWCWRPTVAVVDTSWRPYAHGGRWMYTDYGWYWKSYYTWGWAPFHYGRWHLSGPHGWVWVPGTQWGPAWVTWRHYDGYYGWAPLPPGAVYASGIGMTYYGSRVSFGFGFGFSSSYYTFVPVRHFYSHRPWNYCVPRGRVGPIYNNSTVINNYVQGDGNNTVINVGPGTGAVAAATRTEIQKVTVREMTSGDPKLVRAESLSRDGTTLNVYRPRLPEQAATPPVEVTRRQRESQARAGEVSGSPAAQAAVIKARSTDRSISPSLATTPRTATGPASAPRAVGVDRSPTGGRTEQPRATAPQSSTGTGTRSEPRRVARGSEPATAPVRIEPRSPEAISPQRSVNRSSTPQQPVTQPAAPRSGWSSPTPRIEPLRPAPARPAPVSPRTRTEPSRTVNPSYSITPAPSSRLTPRPATGLPSPASPRVVTPRSGPVAQPSAPSFAPRSPSQGWTPAPSRVAPSTTFSAPAPSRAPSVVPSRPSGAVRSSPAPSPARAPSAPSAAPRSGGTRNR